MTKKMKRPWNPFKMREMTFKKLLFWCFVIILQFRGAQAKRMCVRVVFILSRMVCNMRLSVVCLLVGPVNSRHTVQHSDRIWPYNFLYFNYMQTVKLKVVSIFILHRLNVCIGVLQNYCPSSTKIKSFLGLRRLKSQIYAKTQKQNFF